MATKQELLENELREVNSQLYAAYKRITELNKEVSDLQEIVTVCGMALVLSDSTDPEKIVLDRKLWQDAVDAIPDEPY